MALNLNFIEIIHMQCFSTIACTSNVVGALLRLRLVTASRQGIVKGKGSDVVIQAYSPLTEKENFKFIKIYICKF